MRARHTLKKGDRVEIQTCLEYPSGRGVVTYDRKLHRVGVRFDDSAEHMVLIRHVRKLDELEILGEALND